MAAKQRKHKRPSDLPGTIYLNKKRYWWKVLSVTVWAGIVAISFKNLVNGGMADIEAEVV